MKLILINGPCGIGKSTVAVAMHQTMPLSFLLDIDAQARYISHYREYQKERREISAAISQAIIDACLKLGCDVIVDKMIRDADILDRYRALGKHYAAEVLEIILWASKDIVLKRANNRGWKEGGLLTPEKCEQFWDDINTLKENRPLATVIDVTNLDEQAVVQSIQALFV